MVSALLLSPLFTLILSRGVFLPAIIGTTMRLSEKQAEFAYRVAELILFINQQGYTCTLGEAYRPRWVAEEYARQGKGIANSKHCQRLAIDLNIFDCGRYLRKTEDYRFAGEFWEALGGIWGGRFKRRRDGNHFEF